MNVQPEFYRNKKHVVSKFVRASLLPLLGVAPGRGAGEARIADLRLDFAVFMQWLIPLRRRSDKGADIVVLAASPYEKLERHVRRLSRYIAHLDARCGLLTNGGELRVYEKLPDDSVELVLQCTTDEISSRADDIRRMLKTEFPAEEESGVETGAAEEIPESLEAAVLPESDDVEDDEKPSVSVELPAETPAGMPAELPGDVPDVLPDVPAEPPARMLPEEPESSRMKIIAVYHNKGGVGKTTISVNLAAALRKKGHRVLLIDMDAQANATFAAGLIKFQFEEDDDIIQKYVYHLLASGDFDFIPDVVRRSESFNTPEIDVVPAHIDLTNHLYELTQITASRSRLSAKLKQVQNDYDFAIIDTPPSRDLYAEIPLATADYLLIPSDLRPFANQGLNNVRQFVKEVNEYRESVARAPLVVLGVLPSKIPTNAQYLKHSFPRQKQVVLERYGFPLMESVIYERMDLATSLSRTRKEGDIDIPDPKSIFEFCAMEASSGAGRSAEDFETLADEILTKTGWGE